MIDEQEIIGRILLLGFFPIYLCFLVTEKFFFVFGLTLKSDIDVTRKIGTNMLLKPTYP